MKLQEYVVHIAATVLACAIAPGLHAQSLFEENFDTDQTANWTVNASTGNHAANIFFDYSTVGIPSAPNSGGTTRGMKLQANLSGGVFGGISVSPTGQSFVGDYEVRYDMWLNYNGRLDGGGSGSTQITGVGIGTAGTTPQWPQGSQDSVWFAVSGDGGSTVDYRAYSSAASAGYPDNSTVFAASGAGNRNNTHPYYASFGGETAPAAQLALFPQQTNSTAIGAQGFAWRDVSVVKSGNTVTYSIDGTLIATVDLTTVTLAGNNILFNHSDINATSSTDPNAGALLFGLVDNVRVIPIPEPTTWALLVAGGASLALLRRRRQG